MQFLPALPCFEGTDSSALLSTADGKAKNCDGVWQLRHGLGGAKEINQQAPVGTMGGHFRTHDTFICVYMDFQRILGVLLNKL